MSGGRGDPAKFHDFRGFAASALRQVMDSDKSYYRGVATSRGLIGARCTVKLARGAKLLIQV